MSSQTLIILPTQLSDAEAVRACGDRAFGAGSFRDRFFPASRRHLTTPEEEIKWRADRLREQLKSGDMVHFKCVPEDDHSKVIGYSVWHRPGHYAKGKSVADELRGKSDAGDRAVPQSDLTAQAGPGVAEPPVPVNEGEQKKDDFPAFMDGEAYLTVAAKLDEERRRIWGGDANYWGML